MEIPVSLVELGQLLKSSVDVCLITPTVDPIDEWIPRLGGVFLVVENFSAKLFYTSRTSCGSDYHDVRKNSLFHCQVLVIIDLVTVHLVLETDKHADTTHVTHTLYHEVILREGVLLLFHSDVTKTFLGTVM